MDVKESKGIRTVDPTETGKDDAEAAEDGEPGLESAVWWGARG
jgi:hypothetical protein